MTMPDYADWLRVSQSSGPALIEFATTNDTDTFTPIASTGQWAFVSVNLSFLAAAGCYASFTLHFYADALGTIFSGDIDWDFGPNDVINETVPVLGPYCRVEYGQTHGVVANSCSGLIVPRGSVLNPQDFQDTIGAFLGNVGPVANGGNVITSFDTFTTGKANVVVTGTGVARILVFGYDFVGNVGAYYGGDQVAIAGAWVRNVPCLIGRRSPQVQIFNDSGAGGATYNVGVTFGA
jgi:hypothetical protein